MTMELVMVLISYYRSQNFNDLTIFTFTLDSTNCFLCPTKIRNYTRQILAYRYSNRGKQFFVAIVDWALLQEKKKRIL